jgi:hypothetical protein
MKIACFVNPLVHQRGPCRGHVWSEFFAKLLQPLRRDARCDCMLITGAWFEDWAIENDRNGRLADLLAGLRLVLLDEVSLYRQIRSRGDLPTALGSIINDADDANVSALQVIADVLASQVGDFAPDVVIGFAGDAKYLSALWPHALQLHVERGHFARSPYPFSMYFDHLGVHARSAIAQVGGSELAYPVTSDGRALVSTFRSTMAAGLERLDPFRSHDLRAGFDRVVLLPLQISNEVFFDAQASYRTQFEFLYDVLIATPPDVGVIVTEHPNAEPVLRRTGPCPNLAELRQSFPNMIFFEECRSLHTPSQFLVPRVDGVWSVSSSIAHQALLFGGAVGTPPGTEISHFADATTYDGFLARLGHREPDKAEAFLAWLLERYLVPATLFSDGRWLNDYLERRLDAARSAVDPIDGFVATADPDRLMQAWITQAQERRATVAQPWQEDSLRAELAELAADRTMLLAERNALLNSTSWRMTAPLRSLKLAAGGWRADQPRRSDIA